MELWLHEGDLIVKPSHSSCYQVHQLGPARLRFVDEVVELPEGAQRLVVDEMGLLEANERLGDALVEIGMALGLRRPTAQEPWGAREILAKAGEHLHELQCPNCSATIRARMADGPA